MPNVITSNRTYATYQGAYERLQEVLLRANTTPDNERWLISVKIDDRRGERYVPTLVGIQYVQFAHLGIMVIG